MVTRYNLAAPIALASVLLLLVAGAVAFHNPAVTLTPNTTWEGEQWSYSLKVDNSVGGANSSINNVTINITPFQAVSCAVPSDWSCQTQGSVILSWVTTNASISNTSSTIFTFSSQASQVGSNTTYNWTVTTSDTDGYVDTSVVSIDVFDDSLPPVIGFIAPTLANGTFTNQTPLMINVSHTEAHPHTMVLSWNGANTSYAYSGAYTSLSQTVPADGTYTFYVWVNDTGGNDNITETRVITFDVTPPTLNSSSITGHYNGYFSPQNGDGIYDNITIAMVASETVDWSSWTRIINASGTIKYFTGPNSTANLTRTWTGGYNTDTPPPFAADDSYTINTTMVDLAGNSNTVTVGSIAADNTAPVTTDDAPAGWQSSAFSVTLNCTDAGAGCNATSYRLDGGAWMTSNMNPVILVNTDGNHTVEYNSTDSVFNTEATSTAYAALDTVFPTLSLYLPLAGFYSTTGLSLNYSANDANLDTVWYDYNGTNTTLGGNTSFTALDNQQSSLTLWVNDSAGNTNSTSVAFTVDTAAPVMQFVSPTPANGGSQTEKYLTINISITEANPDTIILNWNGTNQTVAYAGQHTTVTKSSLADGAYTYYVWMNDSAANDNITGTRAVTIYTPAPPVGTGGWRGPATVSYGCTEDWNCTDWIKECRNGEHTRVCTDLNSCGTELEKPSESVACTMPSTETLPPVCAAGEMKCEGDSVVECNAEEDGWSLKEQCEHGCEAGSCVQAPSGTDGELGAGGLTGLIGGIEPSTAAAVAGAIVIAGAAVWALRRRALGKLKNYHNKPHY
jgi:hypothetical protein